MTSTPPRIRRRSAAGRVLIVLGLLGLALVVFTVLVGALMFRSLKSPGTHVDLRRDLLETVGVPTNTEIQVNVPVWLTTLGRIGVSIADAPEEVQAGLEAIHSGYVGVYELNRTPDRAAHSQMLATTDAALLHKGGWSRIVTVMEDHSVVAIYAKDSDLGQARTANVFVMVLEDRELVIVSAKAYTEPLADIAGCALEKALPRDGPLLFASGI